MHVPFTLGINQHFTHRHAYQSKCNPCPPNTHLARNSPQFCNLVGWQIPCSIDRVCNLFRAPLVLDPILWNSATGQGTRRACSSSTNDCSSQDASCAHARGSCETLDLQSSPRGREHLIICLSSMRAV
jgi:hypothetical protein